MGGESIRELYKMIEDQFNAELIKTDAYKEACTRRRQKRELVETCLSKEEFIKGFRLANQLLVDSLR